MSSARVWELRQKVSKAALAHVQATMIDPGDAHGDAELDLCESMLDDAVLELAGALLGIIHAPKFLSDEQVAAIRHGMEAALTTTLIPTTPRWQENAERAIRSGYSALRQQLKGNPREQVQVQVQEARVAPGVSATPPEGE